MAALPLVLFGVPAHGALTNLVLGGDYIWRFETGRPQQVLPGLLANGLSPLLAGSSAAISQIEPVAGGVVAVIANVSTGGLDSSRSAVVFISGQGTARVIAKASAAAVAPGGARVWVQTAVRPPPHGIPMTAPKTVWSPTYAVSLTGRRVSPVLRLPLGLAAAVGAGLLTEDVETGQLRLWNPATGHSERLRLPKNAQVEGDGDGIVLWQPQRCPAVCPVRLTDLQVGAGVTVQAPAGLWPLRYQEPVAFDGSATRFVLPLAHVDAFGNPTAEALYLVDTTTKTFQAIPGGPLASDQPLGLGNPGVQLSGAWDHQGRLWVLATSGYGYFQLGFWTGTGPLAVYRPIQGNPTALAAPGLVH